MSNTKKDKSLNNEKDKSIYRVFKVEMPKELISIYDKLSKIYLDILRNEEFREKIKKISLYGYTKKTRRIQ